MYSVEKRASETDAMMIPMESDQKMLAIFGHWIGGAEMLSLHAEKHGEFRVSSEQRCRDHGCGRTCYEKIGTLDEVLKYAVDLSATHHRAMVAQVERNCMRLWELLKSNATAQKT